MDRSASPASPTGLDQRLQALGRAALVPLERALEQSKDMEVRCPLETVLERYDGRRAVKR